MFGWFGLEKMNNQISDVDINADMCIDPDICIHNYISEGYRNACLFLS